MQSSKEYQGDKGKLNSEQWKEIEGKNIKDRIEIPSRKWEISREPFMQRWAQ